MIDFDAVVENAFHSSPALPEAGESPLVTQGRRDELICFLNDQHPAFVELKATYTSIPTGPPESECQSRQCIGVHFVAFPLSSSIHQ